MTHEELLGELRLKLHRGALELELLALQSTHNHDRVRHLVSKAEGLDLALGYLDDLEKSLDTRN